MYLCKNCIFWKADDGKKTNHYGILLSDTGTSLKSLKIGDKPRNIEKEFRGIASAEQKAISIVGKCRSFNLE